MKIFLLSIGYLLTLIIMMGLTDYLLYLLLNHVIYDVFNWFNGLSFFWKFTLLVIGAGSIFSLVFSFFNAISNALNAFAFYFFPSNAFTLISSIILFLINIWIGIRAIWDSISHFNFWTTIEFIMLVFFLLSINAIFVDRHKMKEG